MNFELIPHELAKGYFKATRLANIDLEFDDIKTEILAAPHRRPSSLPVGTQAVYAFILGNICLKVGKAGPKTQARFTSQHYGASAPSTLAKSIMRNPNRILNIIPIEKRSEFQSLDMNSVGEWLEQNTSRFHLFLPASAPECALSLAEAFIQCRFRPIYEGKSLSLDHLSMNVAK